LCQYSTAAPFTSASHSFGTTTQPASVEITITYNGPP
jgi:hypothetical protein